MKYFLMHQNKKVAKLELDALSHLSAVDEVYLPAPLPIGTVDKMGLDQRALAKWWSTRAIPASRFGLKEVLLCLNMAVPQELLDKCYGLSLSDQYWINPTAQPLQWEEINFFDHPFSEDVGNLLFGQQEASDSISLLSPDNTSDGQLMKKWKIAGDQRILIKGSSRPYHQEALCEVIASRIAERLNIPHVEYSLLYEHEEPFSICADFVTRDTELVSAYHVLQTAKKPNNLSDYEFYVQRCEHFGICNARQQLEKMLVLDFIIANEDRHYHNFGLLRNADTLEWIGIAPIYDCGTSLWYNTQEKNIKPLAADTPSKPFRKTHREQLQLVTDFSWLQLEKLNGLEQEVRALFSSAPDISEARAAIVCDALSQRIGLLEEHILKRTQAGLGKL